MSNVRWNDKYRLLSSMGFAYVQKSEADEFRRLLKKQRFVNYTERVIGEIVKFERGRHEKKIQ
ncbi:hypothetical protein G3M81_12475 [Bacillus paralicheniformis]|uniref:hypothetical protein n=1 Tax=Bacillus TaxID=1386 RepID=UPI0013EEEE78|nr:MULTISPECIES: hypothetical protein [Bacillus]MCY8609920.1 hypothetical protein [Bacillus haynesii]MEC0752155.1 hypothetical protein [Bacillus haynesii]QII49505.1 hypothetical protein G3M81_12475 [Bacillus paralicheniformis]